MNSPRSWADLFFNGQPPPEMTADQFESLLTNVSSMRGEWFRQFTDPRRNIDDECGYPSTEGWGSFSLNPEMYKMMYERMGAARRAVEIFPLECWQRLPNVYEEESPDSETQFEQDFDAVGQLLIGGRSWYTGEGGSPFFSYLKRADVLSGIGSFGVILLGVNDGRPLDTPLDGVVALAKPTNNDREQGRLWSEHLIFNHEGKRRVGPKSIASEEIRKQPLMKMDNDRGKASTGLPVYSEQYGDFVDLPIQGVMTRNQVARMADYTTITPADMPEQYAGVQLSPSEYPSYDRAKKQYKLMYMRVFDESLVQVVQYEANLNNPRFGMPVMYRITLSDPREFHSGVGLANASVRVHWSRVIHVADNLGNSEVFGAPRLRPIWNNIMDLRKLYGAGAEGYWKSCFMGLSFETHPELAGDVKIDKQNLKDQYEKFINSLERVLVTKGMTVKTIAPSVVDPGPQIEKHIEAICYTIGVPVPVFKGYEIGEQASTNNDSDWNGRVDERCNNHVTTRIIIPTVDRLIQCGVISEPGAAGKPQTSIANMLRRRGFSVLKKEKRGFVVNSREGKVSQVRVRRHAVGWVVSNEVPPNSPSTAKEKVIGYVSEGGYCVEWPERNTMSDVDKAQVGLVKTQTLGAYVQGGVEALVPPEHFLTTVSDMVTDDQAKVILEDAKKAHETQDTMSIPPQTAGQDQPPPEGTKAFDDKEQQKQQFDQMRKDQQNAPASTKPKPAPNGKAPFPPR